MTAQEIRDEIREMDIFDHDAIADVLERIADKLIEMEKEKGEANG